MFAFLVNESRSLDVDGGAMFRGFFAQNSEVGAVSFVLTTFLYESVCGNHIVWGARNVSEFRLRHVGDADGRAFHELRAEVRKFGDASMAEDGARIQAAKVYSLGTNKDEVLDTVFGLKVPGLTRGQVRQGYELAELNEHVHGSPRTAWGMAAGLTRLSQTYPYADARVGLDRAAGQLLSVAF